MLRAGENSGGPGSGDPVTAQSFYLFDTPCGQSSRQQPGAAHATHDTASVGASAADDSTCDNPDSGKQPDLMGPSLPAGSSSTPLYDYSSDLSGARPGGLAMIHRGTTCDTSYAASNATSTTVPGKWSIHAWSTNPFASTFHLSGQITMSLITTTIGGASGRGVVCASLLDRQLVNGVRQDRALGSFVYDLSSWPTSPRRLTFTFSITRTNIAAAHRLVLVLGVRSESANDLVFLYDHPTYPSFLEVASTTPF